MAFDCHFLVGKNPLLSTYNGYGHSTGFTFIKDTFMKDPQQQQNIQQRQQKHQQQGIYLSIIILFFYLMYSIILYLHLYISLYIDRSIPHGKSLSFSPYICIYDNNNNNNNKKKKPS